MTVLLKNNVSSTLATAIAPTDTGIVVANGSRFPTITAGDYFYVTLVSQAGQTEIVKVTARVGNSMTVVRAQDGSSAATFQAGTFVEMRVNAASITELRDEASEITIADAGGYYTATTVEGALQEVSGVKNPKSVTALLADTALTYTAGQAGTVIAGDIVRTRAEGFSYAVAASAATNQHITTAGGVKLYVQPVDGAYYPWAAWAPVKDGTTDNYAKLRSAGDACRLNEIGGLRLPAGRYFISQEFQVDWQGAIEGVSGLNFGNDETITTLFFPAGTNGIRVCRATSSTSGGIGDWSRIKSLALICSGNNSNSTGSGIVLEARAHVEDVFVSLFPEDGFRIRASNGDTPPTNANNFFLSHCRATSNGRDGFFISGADANSGGLIKCDSASNGRINFNDSSFLGNGFIFCHSDSPGRRAFRRGSDGQGYRCKLDHVATADTVPITGVNWATYWELNSTSTTYSPVVIGEKYYDSRAGITTAVAAIYHYFSSNANSTTTFVNCYTEGSAPLNSSYLENDRKTIVGGTNMLPDLPNTRATYIGGPVKAVVYADNVVPDTSSRIETFLGSRDGRHAASAFTVREPGFTGLNWGLVWDSANRRWYFGSSSSAARCYELLEVGNYAGLPAGILNFQPQGFALGGKRHFYGTAAPTTGTWARGDIVYHTAPSALGTPGWVCTTAGTPGTWSAMANLV